MHGHVAVALLSTRQLDERATWESLNVTMTPLLPLRRNDVHRDTERQHFIHGTMVIRDGTFVRSGTVE
jgi:hypothetical protein